MKKHSKTEDLLMVLKRKPLTVPGPGSTVEHSVKRNGGTRNVKPKAERTQAPAPAGTRGKAIQFYLHAPDERLIREFAVWLAPHRKRINDSLVIKAVLRAATTGPELLAAYDAAIKIDGRIREKRKHSETP
jgi:hypothetical protein